MGLIDDISKSNSYLELSNEKLSSIIKDAFFPPLEEGMAITLYTGLNGLYCIHLTMMGIGTPLVHYTIETFKRRYGLIVLHLFKKSGMIKALINTKNRTVKIVEGTVVIKEAFSFDEIKDYLTSLTPKEPQEFYLKNGTRKFIK